jgi:hypothetical protein
MAGLSRRSAIRGRPCRWYVGPRITALGGRGATSGFARLGSAAPQRLHPGYIGIKAVRLTPAL